MRILALSDTHFGYEYGRTSQSKKEQINWGYEVFSNVLEIAVKENVDCVLHGGDVFNRSQPKNELISRAYTILEKFAEYDIDFVAIPGNHDKSRLPETLLDHFSSKIHFLNKISEVELSEVSIIGFPFELTSPKKTFLKIKEKIISNPRKNYVILCHQLFDGASFGPHNHIFRNRPDTLKIEDFPDNLILTLSGHIHRTQSIQSNRVQYIGSLIRTSFMEIVEEKGYLIIDLDENHFETTFFPLKSYPMKVFEFDISNTRIISEKLENITVQTEEKILLRFVGRSLKEREIKYLWVRFPAKNYPKLRFSPQYPNVSLSYLYNQ